jgi:Tfp pilus assembly pilus retraction ATPase PilT
MNYINMKGAHGIETIEDLRDIKHSDKLALLKDYQLSDHTNCYYFSQRCTYEFSEV